MATLYRVDGTVTKIKPAIDRKKFKLEEVQAILGGYIQAFPARSGRKVTTVLCDEEGQHKCLPYNHKFHEVSGWALLGDVLVVSKGEF